MSFNRLPHDSLKKSELTLSIPGTVRIQRELFLLSTNPPPGVSCYAPSENNITSLQAVITGPPSSPYAYGLFLISIHILYRYPFEPPGIRFLTPIYHPNIDTSGRICLDTLKIPPGGCWSPAVSLTTLLLSIRALMEKPNEYDALVSDIADLYKINYKSWFENAKNMTNKYACEEQLFVIQEEYKKKSEVIYQNRVELFKKEENTAFSGSKRKYENGRNNQTNLDKNQ